MWLVVLRVLQQDPVHVVRGVLEQLLLGVEDDDGDLAVAQHGQLIGLLLEAELALRESHLGGKRYIQSIGFPIRAKKIYFESFGFHF